MIDRNKLPAELQTPEVIAAIEERERDDKLRVAFSHEYFTGTHTHSLDSKGRIIVPNAFREQLGKTFVIGPSANFKSIALYPTAEWARRRDNYKKLSPNNRILMLYLEQFDALCYTDQECDAQGRVLLPTRIRQKLLEDTTEVDISGAGDHVRIVARKKAEEDFEELMKNMPDVLDAISQLETNRND